MKQQKAAKAIVMSLGKVLTLLNERTGQKQHPFHWEQTEGHQEVRLQGKIICPLNPVTQYVLVSGSSERHNTVFFHLKHHHIGKISTCFLLSWQVLLFLWFHPLNQFASQEDPCLSLSLSGLTSVWPQTLLSLPSGTAFLFGCSVAFSPKYSLCPGSSIPCSLHVSSSRMSYNLVILQSCNCDLTLTMPGSCLENWVSAFFYFLLCHCCLIHLSAPPWRSKFSKMLP